MMIHHAMPRAEYDALDAVNWSTLRHLGKSPLAYDHALHRPGTDSAAMRLGRAAHMAVLEPERFRSHCVVFEGTRRGRAWEAFQEEHIGAEILSDDEHATATCIALSVQSHPVARELLRSGRAEVSIAADIDGTACKGRLDWIGSGGVIVDLKTTRSSCHPRPFSRTALAYEYHGQAAFYSLLAESAGCWNGSFSFIVVESVPPFEVAVYRVSSDVMALGRERVRELLYKREQVLTGERFGHEYPETLELTFPAWAYGSEGDALEGCHE